MRFNWRVVTAGAAVVTAFCAIVLVALGFRLMLMLEGPATPTTTTVSGKSIEKPLPVVIAGQRQSLSIDTSSPLRVDVTDMPTVEIDWPTEVDVHVRNHWITRGDPIPVEVVR